MKRLVFLCSLLCLSLINCNKDEDAAPLPAVSTIVPDNGTAGDTIVISGENFAIKTALVTATFPNGKPGKVIVIRDTLLKVIVPAGSKSGPISIAVDKDVTSTSDFTVYSLYMFGAVKESTVYNATVWKDGVPATYSTQYSHIVEGLVVGNDVHAVGYEYDDNITISHQVYWKNGISVPVEGTTSRTRFTGIDVSGNDVYISGFELTFGYSGPARYWKNGQLVVLSESEESNATDIKVVGNDVYVAGADKNQAMYWKNGVSVPLGKTPNVATSISIVNGDVYVTGNRYTIVGGEAMIWKNGVETKYVNDDFNIGYTTNSVLIVGSDVYIGGVATIYSPFGSSSYLAKFWKNGTENDIGKKWFNPIEVRCMSEFRGNIFMTISDYSFNSYSYVYRNGKPLFSSDEFHDLVLSHQVVLQ